MFHRVNFYTSIRAKTWVLQTFPRAQFTQPPGSAITSFIAGQTITLVIVTITSGSPDRYAADVFFGQVANFPSQNNAANSCSLGVFPSLPLPFAILDGSAGSGDFLGSSTATLKI